LRGIGRRLDAWPPGVTGLRINPARWKCPLIRCRSCRSRLAGESGRTAIVDVSDQSASPASRLLQICAPRDIGGCLLQNCERLTLQRLPIDCRSRLAGESGRAAIVDVSDQSASPASRLLQICARRDIGGCLLQICARRTLQRLPIDCRSRLAGESGRTATVDVSDQTASPASRLLQICAAVSRNDR
jgi:hypothetical protein